MIFLPVVTLFAQAGYDSSFFSKITIFWISVAVGLGAPKAG
jgi:hypothetical protein